MNTSTAQASLKNISKESSALEGSGLIALYEIDVTEVASVESLTKAFRAVQFNYNANATSKIFRFHNNLKLVNRNITFNGQIFAALPIEVSGFEISSNGTLPVPKLTMVSISDGDIFFSNFKMFIRYLNGLVGAKVTRIRTFLKYIDGINFYSSWASNTNCLTHTLTLDDPTHVPPLDFCPDPNAIFPKDVFYVDRKSLESKGMIELELASLIDVQGILLPARVVMEKKCPWQYRGEGCCYEYAANKTTIHGTATLQAEGLANPRANEKDEKIETSILSYSPTAAITPTNWLPNTTYAAGSSAKIEIDRINYYFVSKGATANSEYTPPPPNEKYWMADQCSKTLKGCKIRWANNASFNGFLPFGGFPGIQSRD